MEISSRQYNIILLSIISFVLIISIFKWIDYLTNNKYIVECFTSGSFSQGISNSTSHTVDLPLTTKYSCKNFCGPSARCSITGQQCSADIDCPGCEALSQANSLIAGDNDAGKLTWGVTPNYSPLTSGYGTQETAITTNMYSKPDMANFGVNTWITEFNVEQQLFNQRYKPSNLQYMPEYQNRYSLTGEFIDDGPYPSNAPLPSI